MDLGLLKSLEGFDWDEGNRDKNVKHDVEWKEIEEVFQNPPYVILTDVEHSGAELRWKIFGKSNSKRYLLVVFTIRKNLIRPISARAMNKKEKVFYEEEIKKSA